MQKLFSIFLVICLIFVTLAPSVDANIRIRKGRLNQINNIYAPYYQLPYYQTQINNQITQVPQSSV